MADTPPSKPAPEPLVDAVLLIDGDNDPHLPADFPIGERTLVRVFLRQAAKTPRGLEKRLGGLPFCVTVTCTQGGANAADFVMSLHAGILHATLPMHLPFTLVTNDKALSAIAQELQRTGRQAALWTSHDKEPRRRAATVAATVSRASSRRGGRRRGGRGRRGSSSAVQPQAAAPQPAPQAGPRDVETAKPAFPPVFTPASDPKVLEVAAAYAARLSRIKDPPSRLKTLLNDIANRTRSSGLPPEAILEELKRGHGLVVDERGHITKPA
ncbi:MAG: hypothetical protein KGO96_12915 [Elusimicrobia bacterium]|nr:hypothetical protein [Elusimicrobiota bacterium]MDE2237749.1 hypothetical protein [Elusimicrobiota bacterium]MDE2426796.1 hypothetical protein [Elusimicrobiota bacterium]